MFRHSKDGVIALGGIARKDQKIVLSGRDEFFWSGAVMSPEQAAEVT